MLYPFSLPKGGLGCCRLHRGLSGEWTGNSQRNSNWARSARDSSSAHKYANNECDWSFNCDATQCGKESAAKKLSSSPPLIGSADGGGGLLPFWICGHARTDAPQ